VNIASDNSDTASGRQASTPLNGGRVGLDGALW